MIDYINLPYSLNALEPVISARTLEFHYGKHLQAYVDNLNKLLPGSGLEGLPLEEIVRRTDNPAIFNNAGQVLNHNLYFTQFKGGDGAAAGEAAADDNTRHSGQPQRHSGQPQRHSGLVPESSLLRQITLQWGTLDAFKAAFEAAGTSLFGSGWVWLSAKDDGTLLITQEPGASNPVTKGLKPLLTFDVWEHAYYLDYQNRRAAHLTALWQIVDWDVVEGRWEEK